MKKTPPKKQQKKNPENIRRTLYLPLEVDEFIEKKARLEGRSTSNYVAQIFREKMGEKSL